MMDSKRQEVALKQGLDFDAFESFCEFARANPACVEFGLQASGVYEQRAVHTTARTGLYTLGGERINRHSRQYTYHMGAHKEVEEALGFAAPTDRPEPTEVVLAALTACINAAVSSSALKRGIELTGLETHVHVGWNPYVFLHLTEPEANERLHNQFNDLQVELVVSGKGLSPDDLSYLRESVKRSAVYNLLRLGHDCSPAIVSSTDVTAA